ncbi:hypothetical protein [Corynebacterium otitidis]
MPRIRTIKPEFWSSPSTAKASAVARLTYIAMWNWADDYGRGTANLKELEGFIFPNDDVETLSQGSCRNFLDVVNEVADIFDVTFYEVSGRPYFVIHSWDRHQATPRRTKSKFPPLEDAETVLDLGSTGKCSKLHDTVNEVAANCSTGTGEQGNRGTGIHTPPVVPPSRDDASDRDGTASEGATPPAKAGPPDTGQGQLDVVDAEPVEAEIVEATPAKQKRGSRLPSDWFPDESAVAAVRRRFPAVTQEWLAAEHEKFQDHWAAASGRTARKVDWNAAWRNWMRRALERDPSGGTHVRGATSGPRTTEKMRGYAEAAARVKDRRRRDGAEPD